MSAASHPSRDGFKAVCYRCKYKTFEQSARRCPSCGFPLILLSGHQTARLALRDIFDRTSVERDMNAGAPRLPGLGESSAVHPAPVHGGPLASSAPGSVAAGSPGAGALPGPAAAVAAVPPRRHRVSLALAVLSAIAVGVAAAVLQGGV